jgi:hypothetical protein
MTSSLLFLCIYLLKKLRNEARNNEMKKRARNYQIDDETR